MRRPEEKPKEYCTRCGHLFEGKETVCPSCKTKRGEYKRVHKCTNCGKYVQNAMEKCPACGQDNITYKLVRFCPFCESALVYQPGVTNCFYCEKSFLIDMEEAVKEQEKQEAAEKKQQRKLRASNLRFLSMGLILIVVGIALFALKLDSTAVFWEAIACIALGVINGIVALIGVVKKKSMALPCTLLLGVGGPLMGVILVTILPLLLN